MKIVIITNKKKKKYGIPISLHTKFTKNIEIMYFYVPNFKRPINFRFSENLLKLVIFLERILFGNRINYLHNRGMSFEGAANISYVICTAMQLKQIESKFESTTRFLVCERNAWIFDKDVTQSGAIESLNDYPVTEIEVEIYANSKQIAKQRIVLSTSKLISQNISQVTKATSYCLQQTIQEFEKLRPNNFNSNSESTYTQQILFSDTLHYVFKHLKKRIFMNRMSKKNPKWKILISEYSSTLSLAGRMWVLDAGNEGFFADPFIFSYREQYYIFVEEYIDTLSKGVISCFKLEDGEWNYLGIVLEKEYHLSFPYIFEFEGSIFMIPESSKNNTVDLFLAQNFPYGWIKVNTLLEGNYADTLVLRKDERWWLLTNSDQMEIGSHNNELSIFYSDSLFTKKWTPVSYNPVLMDSRVARNGGLVVLNNKIVRVGQVNDSGIYGRSFRLYEIKTLSKLEYRETLFESSFENQDFIASHHLSMTENKFAMDFIEHD